MNTGPGFWFFMTLATIFALALLSAVLFPLLRRGLIKLRPAMRSNILLSFCVAPIVLGLVIAFAPWFLGTFGLAPAECGRFVDVILPVCGPNCELGRAWPVIFDLLLLVPFAWFAVSSVRKVRAAFELHTRISSLVAIGQPHDEVDVMVIDSDEPIAFAFGWLRSQIVVASCLEQRLSEIQMRAVLAHERAHANRHDAIRYFIAELASMAHLPWIRASLLEDLRLATEQACDEAAVQAEGGRLCVAETLLTVERLFGRHFSGSTVPVHLLGGDLEARVEALLENGHCVTNGWRRMILAGALFCGVAAIVSAVPLHQWMGAILVYVQG